MQLQGADAEDDLSVARTGGATRQALLVTAERMFGDLGIDAVSLLAIVREAGLGNKNAIQYHFGSKEGLIKAIIRSRAERIEQRRAELLVDAAAAGRLSDVGTLVEAMFLPVADQVDAAGQYTFARFLLQFLNHPGFPEAIPGPMEVLENQPVTSQLKVLLHRVLPHLTPELIDWRVMMELRLLVSCLVGHEKANEQLGVSFTREQLVQESLNMVAAGLAAPAYADGADLARARSGAAGS
ncbi:helix-turn-helix domain-containing protein [Pseudofrankia sp. BMG5.37]|uniref:TetR/AcrR family transcriptional regulator n=1 Tax=Pseudofrankia sp. BMG5.37 TaxID=3050035 RepID=UPI0028944F7D|nr:helix-turn-helix domain-containing protein [Pseudofrankia sp. BMG5.37]MDT3442920.1 helix-turn-helix domain-containing protein [Pseudofrankia sp. BMG5.37]